MNRLLTFLCIIIALLSAYLQWYIDFGIRVNFFELIIPIFILIYLIIALSKQSLYLPKIIKTFILFQYGILIIHVASGYIIILNPESPDSILFYIKNSLQLLVYTLFFTCLLLYLSELNLDKKESILKSYIWGVALSSVYGLGQIVLVIYFGIDIDSYIHNMIPFFQKTTIEFERQGYGELYRLSGLSGDPNLHAYCAMTALPLILFYAFQKKKRIYAILCMVIILSVVLTISVSGFAACITSLTIYFILFGKKKKSSTIVSLIFVLMPFIIIFYLFEEKVFLFASVKLDRFGTGLDRYNIAAESIDIFKNYPFGIGSNNFSIIYKKIYGIPSFNPHNSWIAILVELGLIGLIYQLIFTAYMFMHAIKNKGDMAKIFISTYAGICVASLGYCALNLFYMQFIINVLFATFVLEKSQQSYKYAELISKYWRIS